MARGLPGQSGSPGPSREASRAGPGKRPLPGNSLPADPQHTHVTADAAPSHSWRTARLRHAGLDPDRPGASALRRETQGRPRQAWLWAPTLASQCESFNSPVPSRPGPPAPPHAVGLPWGSRRRQATPSQTGGHRASAPRRLRLPPPGADLCQHEGKAVWALPGLSPGRAGPAVPATACGADCFRSSRSPL